MPAEQTSSNFVVDPADRVMTLAEFAAAAGISIATVHRRIADGTGPRTIRLSERRLGVRVRDYRAWLDARSA
jgi:prophage regulatory protein